MALLTNMREMIVLVEPAINGNILRKTVFPAINNPLRLETLKPDSKGYYRLLQSKVGDLTAEVDEPTIREDSLKLHFWETFHSRLNQGLLLCHKYLLFASQKQLGGSLRKSCNRYARLLSSIGPEDAPPMRVTEFMEEGFTGQTPIDGENSDIESNE